MRSHLLASLALVACCAAVPAGATTMRHLDTPALVTGSSDIAVGVVRSVGAHWNARHTKIVTDVVFDVTDSFKGEAHQLTLTQLGGEVDGVRVSVPGGPLFRRGEEALLFVWRDAAGRAQVNGLAQGKFDITRDPATGERLVQRAAPGFAVTDARSLAPLPAGSAAPRLTLDQMVREVRAVLRNADPASDR